MRRRIFLVAASSVLVLCLGACDDHSKSTSKPAESPKSASTPPAEFDHPATDPVADTLLKAIYQKPIKGGLLEAVPSIVDMELAQGGEDSQDVRFANQGDVDVTIKEITATTNQIGFDMSGDCLDRPTLPPGKACDLVIRYRDRTGRTLDIAILVTTDSQRIPQIHIPVQINVKSPDASAPKPPPQQLASGTPAPPAEPPASIPFQNPQIAAIVAARAAATQPLFGGGSDGAIDVSPEVVRKSSDPRYDPDRIPWTETSLPVDRTRILTADRIIKAVIETPITNVMCNKVIALVESDVYAPDSANILIPHGTKAIGRCQSFADERVNVQWERMITPAGVNISFLKLMADSGDASGRGGVPGRIEQRAFDRYVVPLVSTSIDILSAVSRAIYGQNQTIQYNATTGSQEQTKSAADQAIDDANQAAVPAIKKTIQDLTDIRKVVVVPGGTRVDIDLQEDIYFKSPYEVVRLADVEYDLQRPVRGARMIEETAPTYGLTPNVGGADSDAQGPTLTVNGHTYVLRPDPDADKQSDGTQARPNQDPSTLPAPRQRMMGYEPQARGANSPLGAAQQSQAYNAGEATSGSTAGANQSIPVAAQQRTGRTQAQPETAQPYVPSNAATPYGQ